MVWTFSGSLSVTARGLLAGVLITATGGFGVWIITAYFLLPSVAGDPSCNPQPQPAACSDFDPCIDLRRRIDFSQLHKTDSGQKVDIVTIDDDITALNKINSYVATAQNPPKNPVLVYDRSYEPAALLTPVSVSCDGCDQPIAQYTIRLTNNQAKVRYVLTGAHSSDNEGTDVTSRYKIRNVTFQYTFPPNIDICKGTKRLVPPATAPAGACIAQENRCSDLYTQGNIQLTWRWNAWNPC